MNVSSIATNVKFDSQGFWRTQNTENISYTEDGHNSIREDEANSFWFKHRQDCINRAVNNNLEEPILDIGGGNGLYTKYLQTEANKNPILIEPGISGVRNALENGVKNIINGSLFDAGILGDSVCSIVLLDVLEHIENDKKFLEELNRILKNNGRLIITVPAYQSLFSDFDREVGHYRRYTLKRLQEKMIENGFKIEYKSYFFWILPFAILFGRFFVNKFKNKTKRKSTGHLSKSSLVGKILGYFLYPELLMIKQKFRIPFGSSCIIVARKAKNDNS